MPLRNSGQDAIDFIEQEFTKVKTELTRDVEQQIIAKTMKKFGLSEETVASLLHNTIQQCDTEETLNILKRLKGSGVRATWRMIYRHFSGDDYRCNNALVELLERDKITYCDAEAVYHIKEQGV